MKPISRRAVLTMGGLGLASTAVGGTGLWRELNPSLCISNVAPGGQA